MRIAILLFCAAFAFGQDASSAPGTPSQPPANSIPKQVEQSGGSEIQLEVQTAVANHPRGAVDILSNTYGIDFGPYLQAAMEKVRNNWFSLTPPSDQMKKGKLAIQFDIAKDGKVTNMRLVASSGDEILDRCAWVGITASNPFPSLPKEFPDAYLRLRFRYYYNPDKNDLEVLGKSIPPEFAHTREGTPISSTPSIPSKSGIAVNIWSSGDSTIPSGESRVLIATVTGTEKKAVKWSVSGLGCANSSCGEIVGNLYRAPSAPPNPSEVTLTAVSKADHTAKASVIVHIMGPPSKIAPKP